LLKLAELGNLALGLAPGGGTGEGFAHGLALPFISETEVGAVTGMTGLMAMTVGLAAAGRNAGD
jgi:hypothetical protein